MIFSFVNKQAAKDYVNTKVADRRPALVTADELNQALIGLINLLPEPPALDADVLSAVNLTFWGDSMTSSKPIAPYPEQLGELGFFNTFNGGIAGETSTQIRVRMLAQPEKFSWPSVIWVGRNNFASPSTVIADITAMVNALGHSKYIILTICNAALSDERIGTTKYNQIMSLNALIGTTWPGHLVDVRTPLVAAWNPALPQDVIDHGYDQIPLSVRPDAPVDYIHLNPKGYKIVATTVLANFDKLTTLSEGAVSLKSVRAMFDNPPAIGTGHAPVIHAQRLSVGNPLFNPAAAPFLLSTYETLEFIYNKQFLEVRGASYFLHDAATGGQGGIAIKNYEPALGGVGAMEISGTNSAYYTKGKGLVFYNGNAGGVVAPAAILGCFFRVNGKVELNGDTVITSSSAANSLSVLNTACYASKLNINSLSGRVFEVYSTAEGIIIPRMAANPATPRDGEIFYNTATKKYVVGKATPSEYRNLAYEMETYTPTGTSDPKGVVGDLAADNSYFYRKCTDGWRRSALLSTF